MRFFLCWYPAPGHGQYNQAVLRVGGGHQVAQPLPEPLQAAGCGITEEYRSIDALQPGGLCRSVPRVLAFVRRMKSQYNIRFGYSVGF
jgi:hypothetical protein